MIAESLQRVEAELRREAVCQRYPEVQRLVVSLCRGAANQTSAMPAGDPRILEIAGWVDKILEWTRMVLTAARASQAAKLRQVHFLKGYLRQTQMAAQMSLDL
jgi:hypothetical protein